MVEREAQWSDNHRGIGGRIYHQGDELVHADIDKPRRCKRCKNKTFWFSMSFEAPYCSPKCLEQEWDNYFDEEQKFWDELKERGVTFIQPSFERFKRDDAS